MQLVNLQPIDPRQRRCASAVAGCLAQCLARLDALDEGLAAAYVSLALEMLRRDYKLDSEAL